MPNAEENTQGYLTLPLDAIPVFDRTPLTQFEVFDRTPRTEFGIDLSTKDEPKTLREILFNHRALAAATALEITELMAELRPLFRD